MRTKRSCGYSTPQVRGEVLVVFKDSLIRPIISLYITYICKLKRGGSLEPSARTVEVRREIHHSAAHPLGVSLPVSELQFHWQQLQAVPGVRFAVPA